MVQKLKRNEKNWMKNSEKSWQTKMFVTKSQMTKKLKIPSEILLPQFDEYKNIRYKPQN